MLPLIASAYARAHAATIAVVAADVADAADAHVASSQNRRARTLANTYARVIVAAAYALAHTQRNCARSPFTLAKFPPEKRP